MGIKGRRPSPALVVAVMALIVAIGGTAMVAHGGKSRSTGLKQHRIKTNPLNDTDPCAEGKSGVFCGHDSISGLRGWLNLGNGYEPVRYARDNQGVVHLQGTMRQAVPGGVASFILPRRHRPAGTLEFPVSYGQSDTCTGGGCDERTTIVEVRKNGHVEPIFGPGIGISPSEGVSLDGIVFAAR